MNFVTRNPAMAVEASCRRRIALSTLLALMVGGCVTKPGTQENVAYAFPEDFYAEQVIEVNAPDARQLSLIAQIERHNCHFTAVFLDPYLFAPIVKLDDKNGEISVQWFSDQPPPMPVEKLWHSVRALYAATRFHPALEVEKDALRLFLAQKVTYTLSNFQINKGCRFPRTIVMEQASHGTVVVTTRSFSCGQLGEK